MIALSTYGRFCTWHTAPVNFARGDRKATVASCDEGILREMVRAESERDRLSAFLFHLGKGLWKSIPVIGPVMEEVVYEQFREQLVGAVRKLSPEEVTTLLNKLSTVMPQMATLEKKVEALSEEARLDGAVRLAMVLEEIERRSHELGSALDGRLSEINGSIKALGERLPAAIDLRTMIQEISAAKGSEKHLSRLLDEYEERREAWIKRLSQNQRRFLAEIPTTETPLDTLWQICQNTIPGCKVKEFRFRLHEFEWFGLVTRRRCEAHEHQWLYRKTEEGSRAMRDER